MLITVLLATYNWPEALGLSLQSLRTQTDLNFEIVIVDDGSKEETRHKIFEFQKDFSVPIHHLWQEDLGFRKSRILNQADFIAQHRKLAAPKYLVTGSRILCNQKLTNDLIAAVTWPGWSTWSALQWRLQLRINKCLPIFLKVPDNRWRAYSKFVWRRIKGCNMACWKIDAQAIGGFDEQLVGWGHEDADFVFRLQMHRNIFRKSGAFATEIFYKERRF